MRLMNLKSMLALLGVLLVLGCGEEPPTNDWVIEDYEVEVSRGSSVVAAIERNRRTGEVRRRPFPTAHKAPATREFEGQEINLTHVTNGLDHPAQGIGSPPIEASLAEMRRTDPTGRSRPSFGVIEVPAANGEGERPSAGYTGVNPEPSDVGTEHDAGIFFNGGEDGDFRARTENIFENPLGTLKREASSRPTTWKRATATPNASRLTVGDDTALPLKAMEASVRVDGFRARVVLDLFFENTFDKQLEGDFQLRIPDTAVPYYLAFGETTLAAPTIPGGLPTTPTDMQAHVAASWPGGKEARVVPRVTAARGYEQTVRRRVDPALLEWTGAGVFEARVFPLMPKKLHRVVVGYEVDLVPQGNDLALTIPLPKGLEDRRVNLVVPDVAARVEPVVTPTAGRYEWHNPATDAISVTIRNPGPLVLECSSPDVGALFATRITPDLPRQSVANHDRAVFLVDVSLSANPERFNTYLALMEEILQRNRTTLREFAVAFFNVETFWWRDGLQKNTPESVASLRDFANELALEGATDLGQALREVGTVSGPFDLFLLSDGSVTWGEGDAHALTAALPAECPLFAYTTGASGTDLRVLRHLSGTTGGGLFSVAEEGSLASAATAHRQRPWLIDHVALKGCSDLMLRGEPTSLYPGQSLLLVGRGAPGPDARVDLTVTREGESKVLSLPLGRRLRTPLAASTYGHVAVGRLESADVPPAEGVRAYAQHFRVVGRTCSLLMLESEEDYRRFDIKPQDDAKVVREVLAAQTAGAHRASDAESRGSPRQRFERTIDALASVTGVDSKVWDSVRSIAAKLPNEAFHVPQEALHCTQRGWSGVGTQVREQMRSGTLLYDAVVQEARGRMTRHGAGDGLKALSSLVEQRPGDMAIARDVGHTALAWGKPVHAYHLMRRVIDRRPNHLPTYVQVARCLADMGRSDLALLHFEAALLAGELPNRFGSLGRIVLLEYVRFLAEIQRGERATSLLAYAATRLTKLRKKLGFYTADIVVLLSWNTDRTDVDLHLIEPSGEHCYYQHPKTESGATLSTDVTAGMGPEMYILLAAPKGLYGVQVMKYASDFARTGVRTRAQITVYENWGRPNESVTRRSVTMTKSEELASVATIRR